jgi:hypothetical protein
MADGEQEYSAWLDNRLDLATEKLKDFQLGTDVCTQFLEDEGKFIVNEIVVRRPVDFGNRFSSTRRCLLEESIKYFLIASHPCPFS